MDKPGMVACYEFGKGFVESRLAPKKLGRSLFGNSPAFSRQIRRKLLRAASFFGF